MACGRSSLIALGAGCLFLIQASAAERSAPPRLDEVGACLTAGQPVRLAGRNFGSKRQYDLEFLVGRERISPNITRWQDTLITIIVPRELSPGQSITLVLRDRASRLPVGNKIGIRLCTGEARLQQTPQRYRPASGQSVPGGIEMQQGDSPPPAPTSESRNYEAREVLVVSPDMDAARRVDGQARQLGFSVKRRRTLKNLGMVITVFRAPESSNVSLAIRQLQKMDPKLALDANHRYRLSGNTGSTAEAQSMMQWGQAVPGCGRGIRIGMIDTLVDNTHPSLIKARIVSHSLLPLGVAPADKRHATAIASILVGQPGATTGVSGLLPGAELYDAGVFRQRGSETDTTAELILSALDWLQGHRVSVINISLAGDSNVLLERAVQQTLARGHVLVAAAGNGGATAPPAYPAAWPDVIAVTAVDTQSRIYRQANRGDYIEFAAPGVDIWAARAGSGAAFHSGTSFAAPFVAAAVAQQNPQPGKFTRQKRKALQENAKDLGDPGRDSTFGHGLLQARSGCNK